MRRSNKLFAVLGVACSWLWVGCGAPVSNECDPDEPDHTFYRDEDTDGYGDPAEELAACEAPAGYVDNALDCDDADERIQPDTAWHPDVDGDGFGDSGVAVTQCVKPADHILDGSDCDDNDADLSPTTKWFADADGDGFGDAGAPTAACEAPAGHVANSEDCDDTSGTINPTTPWYEDGDGDGFGAGTAVKQCEMPAAHVLIDGDCDDADPILNPNTTWFLDADGDLAGNPAMSEQACAQPAGHVLDDNDCDDGDKNVFPGLGSCPFDVGGVSCKAVLDEGNSKGTGAYLVDPDGAGSGAPIVVWCDMKTDGGGWTALLNPSDKQMPTPTYPGLGVTGTILSGTDTCSGNPGIFAKYGHYGVQWVRCGDLTIRTTLSFTNPFDATDLMFTATLHGQGTATVTADGVDIPEDVVTVDANGATCEFHNAAGTGAIAEVGACWNTWIDADPAIHTGAFTGALNLELTTGPGCSPTCQYGEGHNIARLFVR